MQTIQTQPEPTINPFVRVAMTIIAEWRAEGRVFSPEDVHAEMVSDAGYGLDAPFYGTVDLASTIMRDLEMQEH